MSSTLELNTGSHWHRWDPHLHAPGTLLNDQFKGDDPWNEYLLAIERAEPAIEAIGVTDYYTLSSYERLLSAKQDNRLPHVQLVFPNVEMRLVTGTIRGRPVNIHLLVSPDDSDHLEQLKRFLGGLKFDAFGESYSCRDDDLLRLGKRADASLPNTLAMAKGAEQFKVDLSNLREVYTRSDWARANILIAVAGTTTDGTSGLREDAYTTLRAEIEKFAHIIFAGSPAQREFWIGDGPAGIDELKGRYGGPKPCIHGSDAHDLATVGVPDGDRYTWIKGLVAFDTLRQVCIDPRGRAFVAPQQPISAIPSQAIASIELVGAEWAKTPRVEFNSGMVAIIGARGSGKSALAEMTALGCDSVPEHQSDNSFLRRAAELLGDVVVKLSWRSDEQVARKPAHARAVESGDYPRARYLSQQFVEELCAADRVTDGLVDEIQRVIYEAHPLTDRDGASNFGELLDLRVAALREARRREEAALAEVSERIGIDGEKRKRLSSLRTAVAEKTNLIARYKADRAKLVSKGSEHRVQRLEELTVAADTVRGLLRYFANQRQSLLMLKQEVDDHRLRKGPETLRQAQNRYAATGLKDGEWEQFLLEYSGDVDTVIATREKENGTNTVQWKGSAPVAEAGNNKAFISDDARLDRQPLALLEAEIARLERQVNVDKDTARRYSAISKRIDEETDALKSLLAKQADCEGSTERIKAAHRERDLGYVRVFESLTKEQEELAALHAPIAARIASGAGAVTKLSFTVSRHVDVDAWARRGEGLFDLRVQGAFRGRGRLREIAEASLKEAWENGDPETVGAAMSKVVEEHRGELLGSSNVPPSEVANYRDWLKRLANWLYSTEHISLQYSIDYDGVDIQKLSPGTRGIVLLLLYLALDEADDRPLIIDQPEENLDPKSVHDELVPLFRSAKSKRQVILVTHNANLVVNTDADQIIVADAGTHAPGELPSIGYCAGGLEEGRMRGLVCDLLEGGEEAFRERAKRLRIRLDR